MERDLNAAKVRLYHFLLEKVATELTEDETVQQEIKKILTQPET